MQMLGRAWVSCNDPARLLLPFLVLDVDVMVDEEKDDVFIWEWACNKGQCRCEHAESLETNLGVGLNLAGIKVYIDLVSRFSYLVYRAHQGTVLLSRGGSGNCPVISGGHQGIVLLSRAL